MSRFSAILVFACFCYGAGAQSSKSDLAFLKVPVADSSYPLYARVSSGPDHAFSLLSADSKFLTSLTIPARVVLGYSKEGRPVEIYYFPGTGTKRALIIGGMHGSELSSISVARQVIAQLAEGVQPYYSVIVLPDLFPDNAAQALRHPGDIGSLRNTGRYTSEHHPDPNRQMPLPGTAFHAEAPVDAHGRIIEKENQLLLELIQQFTPTRIVNLHAIKDEKKAGIFADPRTNCNGVALGFSSDSTLAITMAGYIHDKEGMVWGNFPDGGPTALYHNDPPVAPAGEIQKRNLQGSKLPNGRGAGTSLGSWATTEVCEEEGHHNRPPIRLITIEFPGYKRPSDYKTWAEQKMMRQQVQLYAEAITRIFLSSTEEE
jgi:hypothetical protein